MKHLIRLRVVVPVVVAALVVLAGTLVGSPRTDDRVGGGKWTGAETTTILCPVLPGTELVLGQVKAGTSAELFHFSGAKLKDKWKQADQWRDGTVKPGTVSVTQNGSGSGLVGHVGGKVSGDDGRGLVLLRCPEAVEDGWFVGLEGRGGTQVELVNHGRQTAVVDLHWWGGTGKLSDPEALGVRVKPGRTKTVKVSEFMPGDQLVALEVNRRRQYLSVTAKVSDDSGTELLAASSGPRKEAVLTGVPKGDRVELLLANPGASTAILSVQAIGKDGRFAVKGLEKVKVSPDRTKKVTIPKKVASSASVYLLESDQPVVSAVRVTTIDDFASVTPSEPLGEPLVVPVKIAGRSMHLTLVAPGEKAQVRIRALDAEMKELDTKDISLAAGSRTVLELAKEFKKAESVVVEVDGEVHAGIWMRDGQFVAATAAPSAPTRVFVPSVAVR